MNFKCHLIALLVGCMICFSCDTRPGNESSNNEVKTEKKTKKNSGVKTNYRDDGTKKSEISYKDGKKDGLAINYYSDEVVQLKIDYKAGKKHGKHLYYYQNGNLYKSSDYSEDKLNGFVEEYRTNGDLKLKVPYKDDKLGVGTEEYAIGGDIKKYLKDLEILVKKKNTVAANNSYSMYFSLSDYSNVKDVYYYIGDLTDGQYMNDSLEELFSKNKTAETHFTVKPGHFVNETINVMAEITTKSNYPILLKKEVSINVRN